MTRPLCKLELPTLHVEQTAAVMVAYEKVAIATRPDWVQSLRFACVR